MGCGASAKYKSEGSGDGAEDPYRQQFAMAKATAALADPELAVASDAAATADKKEPAGPKGAATAGGKPAEPKAELEVLKPAGVSGEISLGLKGSFSHSLSAVITWPAPEDYPAGRSWILILGQQDTGAVHWLWDPSKNEQAFQLGAWCGKQSSKPLPAKPRATTMVATTYDSESQQYVIYVDGEKYDTVEGVTFNIEGPKQLLRIAEKPPPHKNEFDFPGLVRDLKFWPRVLAPDEVPTMKLVDAIVTKEGTEQKPSDEAAASKFAEGWMALCPPPSQR